MRVSPDFFATLGVNLAMGRTFTEDEAEIAEGKGAGVVIVTDAYWRQRLNSDPNVLGRDLRVNGMPRKIVGVLPPDFRFLSSEARLITADKIQVGATRAEQRHSGGGGTHMIARLKPGATIAEAQSQIDAHNAAVEKDNPEAKMMAEAGFRSPVVPLHARSRALHSSNPLADAGRRVFSPAHRRGQSGQPPSDSRERTRERNGDPSIDGRESATCR